MIKTIPARTYLSLLLLLFFNMSLVSQALASATPKDVQAIYQLSFVQQMSLNMSQTFIDEGLTTGRQELPENVASRMPLDMLERRLREHYAPERLEAKILGTMGIILDNEHAPKIIEIMSTPVWQQATALTRKTNTVVGTKNLEKYIADKLQRQTPRQIRVDLVSQLAELSGMTNLMMELMISASSTTASILLPPDMQGQAIHFEAQIRNQVESMRTAYNKLIIQQLLYTFRHMSDDDLTAYVNYHKSPAIINLNKAITQALQEAFR